MMNFSSMPAAGMMTPKWTPYAAPLRAVVLGQAAPAQAPAPVPVPVVVAPKPPFIDGAFFNLLFDGTIAAAGIISGTVFWKNAKEKTSASEKAGDKRAAYLFYGLGALGAIKGVLDASRIMR